MNQKPNNKKRVSTRRLIQQEFDAGRYVDLWESLYLSSAGRIEKRFGYRPTRTLTVILYGALLGVVDFILAVLFHDVSQARLRLIPIEALLILINITFILGQMYYSRRFTETFVKDVLGDLKTETDQENLRSWLLFISNRFWPFVLGLLFSVGWIWLGPMIVLSGIGEKITAGSYFLAVAGTFAVGTSLYAQLFLWLFPFRLKDYDLQLAFFNPAGSVLIKSLNRLFSIPILLISLLALQVTLAYTVLVYSKLGIALAIILGWAPVLGIFMLHQYALSQVIIRRKNQNLATMERQILKLKSELSETNKNYGDLLQLLAAYEKLERSPNSALSIESILSLLNALFIPLLSQAADFLSRLWKWLIH